MKHFLIIILVSFVYLSAISLNIPNDFTESSYQDDEKILDKAGYPIIPKIHKNIQIPADKAIKKIIVTPINIKTINNELDLIISAQPQILSDQRTLAPVIFSYDIFPLEFLHNSQTHILGTTKFVSLSIYKFQHDSNNNSLNIPQNFQIEIILNNTKNKIKEIENYATNQMKKQLSLPQRPNISPKILYIGSETLLNTCGDLFDWRRITGVELVELSLSEINNYDGNDLQEKIRNAIIDFAINENISHVTLVGDTYEIPDRKFFAFDCEFGWQDDENEIPSDMYYSCLNGNWDANNNGIFGEDDDEPDYLPDVFLSRIPVQSPNVLNNYIEKLIEYEKGLLPDYEKAVGISMALWNGSDSEVAQQYIYDNYFDEAYEINFLYGEDNDEENVFSALSNGANLIQHTGHASWNVMALEDGHISQSNYTEIQNSLGGFFYSIGCWSAALDKDAIAEKILSYEEGGFIGFVGNSRFGWGAPSASSFGFSEFYQREFFKEIFWNGKKQLAELNTLQKLPFLSYMNGQSVFKWVAYELNALGDSFATLHTNNPQNFTTNTSIINEEIMLNILEEDAPLSAVSVKFRDEFYSSDSQGQVILPFFENEIISLYKEGFVYSQINTNSINPDYFITFPSEEIIISQGETVDFQPTIYNPYNEDFSFSLEIFSNFDYFIFDFETTEYTIPANAHLTITPIQIQLKSISEIGQLSFGTPLFITFEMNTTEITAKQLPIIIKAPQINMINLQIESNSISENTSSDFSLNLNNNGNLPLLNPTIIFTSEDIEFSENNISINTLLPFTQEIIQNHFSIIEENLEIMSYNFCVEIVGENYSFEKCVTLPKGLLSIRNNFENELDWQGDEEWQTVSTFSSEGEQSLSCRPATEGSYIINLPEFVYQPNLNISFDYKYKMPMYGEDGVYFNLSYNDTIQTLLFLGAGGALDRDPYIFSDWEKFNLNIDDIIIENPAIGTLMNLRLQFFTPEIFIDYTEYATMEEIGVFFDNFIIEPILEVDNDLEDKDNSFFLKSYPSPFSSELKIAVNIKRSSQIECSIFNIKGQKVKTFETKKYRTGENILSWNGKDSAGLKVSSGVYYLKVTDGKILKTKKLLLLK